MSEGSVLASCSLQDAHEKIKALLAASNARVTDCAADRICFDHGTYMTQTASLLPKRAELFLSEVEDGVRIGYRISVNPGIRAYMIAVAVLFCWTIFAPVLVHRALVYHPKNFIENLLSGIV